MKTLKSSALILLISASTLLASSPLKIDFVEVKDPGNLADRNGLGAVKDPFKIGKFDITAEQYCAMLNAVANKEDTFQLYDARMSSDAHVASIDRKGSAGNYSYAPKSKDAAKLPIVYVNWFGAARFANWMNNGQPTGLQNASTTEAGAYDLTVPVKIVAAKYVDFLNANASKDDVHGLYTGLAGTIDRSQNEEGSFVYSLKGDDSDASVSVPWAAAARFSNWKYNKDRKAPIIATSYCAFLNAIGNLDSSELYNDTMADKIVRNGETGNYTYSIKEVEEQAVITEDLPKAPRVSVNWLSSAKYALWKVWANAQKDEQQTPGKDLVKSINKLNEQDITEIGILPIASGMKDIAGDADVTPTDYRKLSEGAKFFLPSEDQNYKASFYKRIPNSPEYWLYATKSDMTPKNGNNDCSTFADQENLANYYVDKNAARSEISIFAKTKAISTQYATEESSPLKLTPVGHFSKTVSPYGAYDMAGDVCQWLNARPAHFETRVDKATGEEYQEWQWASATRPIRGGCWGKESQLPAGEQSLQKDTIFVIDASVKRDYIGFRLAAPL